MTAADKIAAARALIEPLTGHTPGAWEIDAPKDESVEIGAGSFSIAGLYEAAPDALPDARLIAAAPALRDTVAALADLADAQAQEIERLQRHRVPAEWYADANERRNETEAERDRLRGCFKQIEAAALHGCLTPDLVAQIACAALGDAS